jgi:hypothetical protein
MAVYKRGDNTEFIKEIQKALGVDPIGNFGPKTEDAVKAFQKKHGLTADGIVGESTLVKLGLKAPAASTAAKPAVATSKPSAAAKYNKESIENAVKAKGYKWFEGKDLELNIVGVRNSDTGTKVTNAFDDRITVSYKENGVWVYKEWMNTTDPGTKGVKEYHNSAGVARLVAGQYINSHGLGLHQGKYEALKQFGKVKVYRDANRDMNYDEDKIQEGIFGINIHKAGADSTFVENWSEGCQVFKRAADFEEFMTIARKSASAGNKSFTYTLIESKDIV